MWVTCMLFCDVVVFICSFAVYELYLNGLWTLGEGNLKVIGEAQLFSSDRLSKPLNSVACFCTLKYWYFVCNVIWLKPSFVLRSTHSEYPLGYYNFFCNCICVPYYYCHGCFFFPLKSFQWFESIVYSTVYIPCLCNPSE